MDTWYGGSFASDRSSDSKRALCGEPATSFDVDLLKRFLGYKVEPRRQSSDFVEAARELMTVRVKDLAVELEELRRPVAASFDQATWDMTRRKLIDLAHRRDAELFGRPYSPDK